MTSREWADRWKGLASGDLMTGPRGEQKMVDRWRRLAGRLDEGKRARDPLLDFVLERLAGDATVIDIGAGVGRWTVPLAERAARVTAVEPLPAMREILETRLRTRGIGNVTLVDVPWLDAEVEHHDVAVSVHSSYTSPDLLAFVRKMEASAGRCYVVLRIPAADGVIGELSEAIRGEWHDSPNFVVGFNALLEAGIHPNVLVEEKVSRSWVDQSIDEAVSRARRHLHLEQDEHDAAIRAVLERRLVPDEGGLRWPDGMRSAMCYWESSEFRVPRSE